MPQMLSHLVVGLVVVRSSVVPLLSIFVSLRMTCYNNVVFLVSLLLMH